MGPRVWVKRSVPPAGAELFPGLGDVFELAVPGVEDFAGCKLLGKPVAHMLGRRRVESLTKDHVAQDASDHVVAAEDLLQREQGGWDDRRRPRPGKERSGL